MILVVGSTGLVGGMIARGLLDQGQNLRILVRTGSNYQSLVNAGAHPIIGDLKDPASLVPACAGVDTVITTASAGSRGGTDTPQSVDLDGNRHLIDVARAAGVKQFIFVSSIAADENSPIEIARAKAQTEAYLRSSGIPYTILASNGITDVNVSLLISGPIRAAKPVTLVGEARRRHSFISARDVAAFAIAAVDHPVALNQRVVIAGPEAYSWWDVIAAYERELGREIAVQQISPGDLLPNLPPIPGLTEFLSGLMAALETFDTFIDMTDTAQRFGVRLTSFEDFVRQDAASIAALSQGAAV